MQEKRREPRRVVKELILVWDNRDNSLVGQVADMTENGVQLVSRWPVEVGSTLYCQMDLPYEVDGFEFLNIELFCRRCSVSDVGDVYACGFEFRNLLPETKTALRRFIQTWRPEDRLSSSAKVRSMPRSR
jgi:hypothetical protein